MRKFKFEKLVRDKIAEAVLADGGEVETRELNNKEFIIELKKKILEEAKELSKTKNNKELILELSDIQEVMDTLTNTLGVNKKDLKKLQKDKSTKMGNFKKRIY